MANEVLDAMAVERFRYRDKLFELFHVCAEGDTFAWRTKAADGPMATRLVALNEAVTFPDGFISEINPGLESWIASVAETLARGLLLLIDYGGPRHEVYHPQRSDGTLMCHYRHRAHADPFLYPGLQDMTAHVDFTAVAEVAVDARLEVHGYTSQSWFLLDCGMDRFLSETDVEDSTTWLRRAQQAKTLMLPDEMGERFKCMGLSKGIAARVPGFCSRDDRHRRRLPKTRCAYCVPRVLPRVLPTATFTCHTRPIALCARWLPAAKSITWCRSAFGRSWQRPCRKKHRRGFLMYCIVVVRWQSCFLKCK